MTRKGNDIPSEAAVTAMEALFSFHAAVADGDLTISDLQAVMRLAIGDGHDMMTISLAMAQAALGRVREERRAPSAGGERGGR